MQRHHYIFILFLLPLIVSAQILLDSFDGAVTHQTINWSDVEGSPSTIELRDDSTDVHEGDGKLYVTAFIGALNQWGSYAQFGYNVPEDSEPMDWTDSDALSLWLNVVSMPDLPDNFVFRVHLADQPDPDDPEEEYIFEHTEIADDEDGWVELIIPLVERETDGSVLPNDEGFVLFPKTWGGGSYNNEQLDLDKLVGYSFALVTTGWSESGPLEEDEIEIALDYFTRNGCCSTLNTEIRSSDADFSLSANYPNPFNPATEIQYRLPRTADVRLNVFNLLGQEVKTLVHSVQTAGTYRVSFQADNLPAGAYLYRLQADDFIRVQKMILSP